MALDGLSIAAVHTSFACDTQPCDDAARGAATFLDGRLKDLGANGQSCATCHMPVDHFQLSPQDVETRFQRLEQQREFDATADDPLFRPIDADDFRVNGDQAQDFSNLRQNGLVRITFPLPANIRLINPATNQPSAETTVDVWRSVPSVENVALSGPGPCQSMVREGPMSSAGTSWTRAWARCRNRRLARS